MQGEFQQQRHQLEKQVILGSQIFRSLLSIAKEQNNSISGGHRASQKLLRKKYPQKELHFTFIVWWRKVIQAINTQVRFRIDQLMRHIPKDHLIYKNKPSTL